MIQALHWPLFCFQFVTGRQNSRTCVDQQISENPIQKYRTYNYHCLVCHKGFMATNDLRGHMSWHTGIKEYKCTICVKEFRYKHAFVKHNRTFHNYDNYDLYG